MHRTRRPSRRRSARNRHGRDHLVNHPVNDAPVNTVPGAQTVNEDTALAIGGVSVNDVDGSTPPPAHGHQRHAHVTTGGGATIAGNGSAALTFGHAAQINAALASLTYRATPTSMAPTR